MYSFWSARCSPEGVLDRSKYDEYSSISVEDGSGIWYSEELLIWTGDNGPPCMRVPTSVRVTGTGFLAEIDGVVRWAFSLDHSR